MSQSGGQHREGGPEKALPPASLSQGRRWVRWGFTAGLLAWLALLPLLGDPRISYRVTPVDGRGSVLVGRSSFRLLAETPLQELASTQGQLEMAQPLLWALAMPEVRQALAMQAEGPVTVGPWREATGQLERVFSYPEQMAPGARTASLAQVMNATDRLVLAQVRPSISQSQDTRLCGGLRAAIIFVEPGQAPQMLAGGALLEMSQGGPLTTMDMDPGERYSLAILVSVPVDLSNEYQGASCTVDFLLDSQGT